MSEDILKNFSKSHEFVTKEQMYAFYEQVAKDIQNNIKDEGGWTKAFVDANGDEQKAKVIYIKLMVERLVLAEEAKLEV